MWKILSPLSGLFRQLVLINVEKNLHNYNVINILNPF